MRNLRILFMGTPEFATSILDRILTEGYTVVGVVTVPDKPAGRGRKLQQSDVKQYALKKKLSLLQPTNLKSEAFQDDLNRLNPNLTVVVAFRMLPKQVWQFPEYGTFNLHASLLPQYRGAAPIHWAVINGEDKTGVTTFFIDDKIDTGEIILQEEIAIDPDETVGQLHDRLMLLGGSAVVKTLQTIEKEKVDTLPQPKTGRLKTAYKLNTGNTKIDWTQDLDTVYNKVRGLNPFPVAWTTLYNGTDILRIKLYASSKETGTHNKKNGCVLIDGKTLKIAAEGGYLLVEELQLPNKKKMSAKDLLNGFSFEDDAYVS